MYQVLFAEDELLVRLGLQKAIPWERFQMKLSAQAEDGLQAFELFEQVRPDVVITDICMAGMDGYELIKKIREIDKECAIIVISCLEDFETLRKMIPYQIMGYIAKAGMCLEEVYQVLEKTRDYLEKIGRKGKREVHNTEKPEESLKRYLAGEEELHWDGQAHIKELLVLEVREEDREKINDLAMHFLYDLVQREIPQGLIVEIEKNCFCVLIDEQTGQVKERKEKIRRLFKGFLGISLQISWIQRNPEESLREAYRRMKQIQSENMKGNRLIEEALYYIQKNYKNSMSLNETAAFLGLSPGYFSTLFKKEMDKTYVEYLNEIRLKEAAKDLLESEEKLVSIAENNGFNNVEYFCRAFKKYFGLSPARWREKNK